MKFRNFAAIAAFALLALVACNRVNPTTTISGNTADGVDEVYISVPDMIDTTVVAVDGHFEVVVPTNVTTFSTIASGDLGTQFIADGTHLTVDFLVGSINSDKPRKSVNERYNGLVKFFADFNTTTNEKLMAIYNDSELTDDEKETRIESEFESLMSELKDNLQSIVKKNKDNFVGVIATAQASQFADNDLEVQSYIDLLSDNMKNHPEIKAMTDAMAVRDGSAEGCMFTDFAVNAVKFDENGDATVAPVCLSDYVGQGKYILVDFWASWCGPCRQEIPNIMDVYENFAGDKFDVLSIAVWDKPMDTYYAANEEGISWNQIVCTEEDASVPTKAYGIEAIPQIILFGPDGTIVARGLRGEEIAKKVSEVLGY